MLRLAPKLAARGGLTVKPFLNGWPVVPWAVLRTSRVVSVVALGLGATGAAYALTAQCNPAPEDWVAHVDPASQKTYYYNSKTGQTSWTKPAPPPPPPPPPPAPPAAPSLAPDEIRAAAAEEAAKRAAQEEADRLAILQAAEAQAAKRAAQEEADRLAILQAAEAKAAEEAARKAAAEAHSRKRLSILKLSELKRHATALGVPATSLDEADDTDNPRAVVTELILHAEERNARYHDNFRAPDPSALSAPPPLASSPGGQLVPVEQQDDFAYVTFGQRIQHLGVGCLCGFSLLCCLIPTCVLSSKGYQAADGALGFAHYFLNIVYVDDLNYPIGFGQKMIHGLSEILVAAVSGPIAGRGDWAYCLYTGGKQTLSESVHGLHLVDADSVDEYRQRFGTRSSSRKRGSVSPHFQAASNAGQYVAQRTTQYTIA